METKGKVDVLAVIDESIRVQERYMPTPLGGTNEHPVRFMERMHDLKTARAAVAELVDAATLVADSVWVERETTANAVRRLRDAISALRSSQGGLEGDEGEGRG